MHAICVICARVNFTICLYLGQPQLRAAQTLETHATDIESEYDELNLVKAKGERDGWLKK